MGDNAKLTAALDAVVAPWSRDDAPGLAVGVRFADGSVWRRGAGMASLQAGVALGPATRLRIGSITKQMLCAVIFTLAEERRLDIEADACAYLPELPPLFADLPLRRLIDHTSGLWDNLTAHYVANGPAVGMIGEQEAFADVVRQSRLAHRPGERVIYSNAAYAVLTRIVEAIEGEPLEAVLERRLFAPLSMHDTALVRRDASITEGLADLHLPGPRGWMRGQLPIPVGGEGGVVSTVDDMLRWLAHLDEPVAFPLAAWDKMREPVQLADGRVSNFRHGVMTLEHRGASVLLHDGGVIGGLARALKVPALGLDVVVLANRGDLSLDEVSRALIDAAAGGRLSDVEASPDAALEGSYYAPGSGRLFRFGGGFIDVLGGRARLRQIDDVFVGGSAETSNFKIAPSDKTTCPMWLDISEGAEPRRFERLPEPSAADVPPRGRWRIPDLAAVAEIALAEDGYRLTICGAYGIHAHRLAPVAADLWEARSLASLPFRPLLEIERGPDGQAQVIHLSTQRLIRLPMVRE